jgi:hypothetical protein
MMPTKDFLLSADDGGLFELLALVFHQVEVIDLQTLLLSCSGSVPQMAQRVQKNQGRHRPENGLLVSPLHPE